MRKEKIFVQDREEIRRLKKENRELKKKLYKLEKETHAEQPQTEDNSDCYRAGNYFAYLLAKARKKDFFAMAEKFAKYFRNSLWVTRIFRWGVLLYQYLQAGAFVILYTAAFILIIPIMLALTALTLILTLLLRSQNAKKLLKESRRDVVFLIPNGKEGFDRDFLREEARAYPDSTVLIVTPFFFKKIGVGSSEEWFVCYRKEENNIYILRNYFFFYFRKRLKKEVHFNIREVHVNGKEKM